MVLRLSNTLYQFKHIALSMLLRSKLRRDKYFKLKLCFLLIAANFFAFSQSDASQSTNFKNDSSFIKFGKNREKVAKAQIVSLKNNGAILIRLKTNSNTINRLKKAGNIDLATQVERETFINNKAIIRAFTNEFKFCPTYFFTSDFSDSVKNKQLTGVFVDTNLVLNSTISCNHPFYLIAEQGTLYDSSLGLVTELQASKTTEKGTPAKDVFMVIKNRFFIQLNKPFPFYQQGYSMKKYASYVKKLNASLEDFYSKNKSFVIPDEIKQFVY